MPFSYFRDKSYNISVFKHVITHKSPAETRSIVKSAAHVKVRHKKSTYLCDCQLFVDSNMASFCEQDFTFEAGLPLHAVG